MDILQDNAEKEFALIDTNQDDKATKFAQEACQRLTIITTRSIAGADNVEVKQSITNENGLIEKITRRRLFDVTRPVDETPEQSAPYLELVFLPPPKKMSKNFPEPKGFSITKECFEQLFGYLRIDYALLTYLTSSRSGWYCVRGQDGRHSFLYKDYMYTLAWTFDTRTRETKGMLAARSKFETHSRLRRHDGNLQLPGLSKALLDQPLALAFIALTDCINYMEQIIEKDGYKLGDIEGRTGYGLWVKSTKPGEKSGKESAGINLKELEEALRNIAELIGKFLTLLKSVEIALSMTKSIQQAIQHPKRWGAPPGTGDTKPEDHAQLEEPSLWEEAVHLLQARIHSVDQSAQATVRRAKAMSSVVSGLISRLVAQRAVADGSSMKVIALMTMFFLPATFISALWAVPALDDPDVLTKQNFGIYWVVTVPVTLMVFVAWNVLNNDKLMERINKSNDELMKRTKNSTVFVKLKEWIKHLDVFSKQDKSPKCREDTEDRKPSDEEMGVIVATQTQQPKSSG